MVSIQSLANRGIEGSRRVQYAVTV